MSRSQRLTSLALAALLLPAHLGGPLAQGLAGGAKGAPYVPPAEVKPEGTPAFTMHAGAMPSAEEMQLAADDPPALVGRVARAEGGATLRLPGAEDWQPARLNTAITEGTAIWTEPGGRLALDVGQSRLFLEAGSALQLDELEEDGLRATLAEGTAFLRAQGLGDFGGLIEVATPEAQLATAVDGRYLVEAASAEANRPGRIAVLEGAAEVTPAGGTPVRLVAGEALVFAPGAEPQRAAAGGAVPIMAWALAAEPRRAIPEAARGMTGAADLAAYGRWDRSPDYGDVWYPPVQADWQPYRDGNWEWREPWGWTWVDAAPWGFAPAHYGRWVQVGPRWGWAPQPVRVVGPRYRPVWAPALVAFFGGVSLGIGARPVGWVPLAPREPYYPWYRASPRYVQRVNVRQVVNVVNVRNVWVQQGGDRRWDDDRRRDPGWARFHEGRLDGFRNRRAAVQVEERVMRGSLPVGREARPLRIEDARRAEPIGGLPLRPGAETRGLTARGADRFEVPREALRRPDPDRGAPPPRVRAALAEPRPAADPREAPRRAAERRDDPRPDARPDPRPDPAARAVERAERQRALRQGVTEEQRRSAPQAEPRDPQRAPADRTARPDDAQRRQRIEALRPPQDEPRRLQPDQPRRPPPEQPRPPQAVAPRPAQDEARRQQQEQARQQQREMARQQQEQARRQQQEQARQQQREMARQQQEQARRQQQEQARQQQREMARQQQEQARRQQQEQARQQQREMARQQQEQARRQQQEQARQQQREMARQQQEQARRQQQEQARQQQREMARQQQEQARRQQQEQARQQQREMARQQQEQARQQQREQARQQQAEQRRQERQQQRQ